MPQETRPADRADTPSREDVRSQLERILASPDFDTSERSRGFLRFVVECALNGRQGEISQQAIAAEVFGRPGGFDPSTDPIVRIQAGRVRRSLERYYLTGGAGDPVSITIPKGAYVPCFALRQPSPETRSGAAPCADAADAGSWPTLLVSPLRNLTGRPEVGYIAQGLASDLAAELSRYTDTHVFLLPEPARPESGICPARFELTGTIAARGDELKINVHLVDGATGRQTWACAYRCRTGPGLGAALDELVQSTAATIAEERGILSAQLLEETARRPPLEGDAYEAILRHLHFERAQAAQPFLEALQALRRAVRSHPDCALCWSYLARLGAIHWSNGMPGEAIPIEDSLAAARRGVALDPSDIRGRLVLGYVQLVNDQVDDALREADAALRLNRDSIFWLDAIGYLLTVSGDWDRGPELIREAVEVNPFCRRICHAALWLDALRRNDPPAALSGARAYAPTTNFWSPLMCAVALASANRVAEAVGQVERLLELRPDFPERGHWFIKRYVKFDDLVDRVESALEQAGLQIADQGLGART